MGRTADAIAEGVAIATSAARLVVKNRILVGTIGQDESFEVDHYAAAAREALLSLAKESEDAATNLTRLRKRAHGRYSDPAGTHDYRDRDVRNLRRRAKQSAGVASKLRALAEDPEAVNNLVEQARESAWADVANNLQRRLHVEGMRPDQDPEYEAMRDARMQALRLVDLQALAVDSRARRKRETAAAKKEEAAAEKPAKVGRFRK